MLTNSQYKRFKQGCISLKSPWKIKEGGTEEHEYKEDRCRKEAGTDRKKNKQEECKNEEEAYRKGATMLHFKVVALWLRSTSAVM